MADSGNQGSPKRSGLVVGVLFALPFAAVGVFAAWLVVSDIATWARARTWSSVPATLHRIELEEHAGDDATTYRVRARYSYRWDGATYEGDTVGLSNFADNIGPWHERTYRDLVERRDAGSIVLVRVNPSDPSQSILRPDLRWELLAFEAIFGAVFGLVGFGLLAAIFWGKSRLEEEEQARARFPTEPWRWREEWASGRIPASTRGAFHGAAGFALLWNLISAPTLYFVPRELAAGNRLAAIALLFPLIGVFLAGHALRLWLRWRRFGPSTLALETVPLRLDRPLRARLHTGIAPGTAVRPRYELACSRLVTSGTGGDRSTRRQLLWQDIAELPETVLGPTADGSCLAIEMQLPPDAPATTFTDDEPEVEWHLAITLELDGIDYASRFELPVAPEIEERATPPRVDDTVGASPRSPARDPFDVQLPERLAGMGVAVESRPDGRLRVDLARARHKLPAAGLASFTAIWLAVVVGIVTLQGPWLFAVLFGLFVPLLLWGLTEMLLVRRVVEAGPDGLRYRRDGLWRGRTRKLPREEIRELRVVRGMQAGNHLYWRIEAIGGGGKKVLLATEIDDLRAARGLADRLEAALHAGPDGTVVSPAYAA